MSKIKIGINGFGRIGRNVFKLAEERSNMEVVGINDLTDTKTLAHLLKYDSTQGKFNGDVSFNENSLIVNGKEIRVTAERLPIDIKWAETPDVVVEATGIFRSKESNKGGYGDHLKTGAKKVILTVPAKDQIDRMIVLGVNDDELQDDDQCVSNASCTTNCLAPIAKVLNDRFGIESGLMTTIHAYTGDQRILDFPHKDLRRARAAGLSMIPTTTGAAKAVSLVLPELEGKLNGLSVRVPTPNVSLIDFVVVTEKGGLDKKQVNEVLKKASDESLKGILGICDIPLVSIDFNSNPLSSIVDAECTDVINGNMVKIYSWYDNESGYSNRMVDLALMIGKSL